MRSGTIQALPLLLLLCVPVLAGATRPPASLSGQVFYALTDVPIPEAVVVLEPAGVRAVTDEEGRFTFDGLPDTITGILRISHPDFLPTEVPLGSASGATRLLEIGLYPRVDFAPLTEEQAQARVQAEAEAAETGGTLWPAEDFSNAAAVTHVLDLLLYSGMVEDFAQLDDERRCIRIRRDVECASVRVGGTPTSLPIHHFVPGEIDSFLIIPPELTGPGSRYEGEGGVVVLFLRPLVSP